MTVADQGSPAETPTANVNFTATAGTFPSGSHCTLVASSSNPGGPGTCQIAYTPPATGLTAGATVPLQASYIGDSDHKPSTATVVVQILVFIVIMFCLAELPLIGYLVAPEATQLRVAGFQGWMSRNGRTVGMWAAALIGAYLTIKGIVNAV